MKLLRGILVMLMICCALVGIIPTGASADPTWPVEADIQVRGLIAHGDNEYTLLNCEQGTPGDMAQYFRDGVKVNNIDHFGSPDYTYCEHRGGSTYSALVSDGTFFTTQWDAGDSKDHYVAIRHGRKLWSTDMSSPVTCSMYGTDKQMHPASMSIGPDGNIYGLFVANSTPQVCPDRLVGIDAKDGDIIFDKELTDGPAGGSGVFPTNPAAWTYDDKIVVVDKDSLLREFSYLGVEDTGAQYQFVVPTSFGIYSLMANESGTVFASTFRVWAFSGDAPILFHKDNGTDGKLTARNSPSDATKVVLRDNDSVAEFEGSSIRFVNFSTDSYSTLTPTAPSGYSSSEILGYAEDEDGDGVVVRRLAKSTGEHAVSVDFMDATTHALTNKLLVEEGTGVDDPTFRAGAIDRSIADGQLYLAVCLDSADCVGINTSVYKVELGGFGDAAIDKPDRNGYMSTKQQYVAMGDSYSSGEGNPTFTDWTGHNDVNECHRSAGHAYPTLLASDDDLDLDLVDFVACSGATTANVLSGGTSAGAWNELLQVDALSEDTDVVTLTIGGNDIGFSTYAVNCTIAVCGPSSVPYANIMANIDGDFQDDLLEVYSMILERSGDAHLYVAAYPYLVDDPASGCTTFDIGSDAGIRNVTDALNNRISDAVDDVKADTTHPDYANRITFVAANSTNSSLPFDGKYLCSSTSYFNDVDYSNEEYSYHPNHEGHVAYEEIFENAM